LFDGSVNCVEVVQVVWQLVEVGKVAARPMPVQVVSKVAVRLGPASLGDGDSLLVWIHGLTAAFVFRFSSSACASVQVNQPHLVQTMTSVVTLNTLLWNSTSTSRTASTNSSPSHLRQNSELWESQASQPRSSLSQP